jgi:hypothetical protein
MGLIEIIKAAQRATCFCAAGLGFTSNKVSLQVDKQQYSENFTSR